jgi:hypothetical protein
VLAIVADLSANRFPFTITTGTLMKYARTRNLDRQQSGLTNAVYFEFELITAARALARSPRHVDPSLIIPLPV